MAELDTIISEVLVDPDQVGDPDHWRFKVLMAVVDNEPDGATDNELADLLQAPGGQNNIRPRRGEITERGYLVDSGQKRKTSAGKAATVWRLSPSKRPTFSVEFREADCALAGRVDASLAGGTPLDQSDRGEADVLRSHLALFGRRVRRESVASGVPLYGDIDPAGPLQVSLWRTGSTRDRLQLTFSLHKDGFDMAAILGGADVDDEDDMARTAHFRTEMSNLPDATLATLEQILSDGWTANVDEGDGKVCPVSGARDWLQALAASPSATGVVTRTVPATDLSTFGLSLVDWANRLGAAMFSADARAEAAMRDPVQALVKALNWDEVRARRLLSLAERSRQLLFAGPPGTGKTLAARALAGALADQARVKLVQFHPTYAYEDFVEGIRPVLEDAAKSADGAESDVESTGLRYRIRPGAFKVLVQQALKGGTAKHFLIIDEMNRANLPRVLGELLFSLEYRGPDNQVELAYSSEAFYVPENLWVIGTMNTADRSVSLLDAAMRRRFKEVRFDVDYQALKTWHTKQTSLALGEEAVTRLKRLNAEVIELLDDDRAIGHSFLMRPDLSEVGFDAVWAEDLEPVLRDHLLGRTEDIPVLREAFLGEL